MSKTSGGAGGSVKKYTLKNGDIRWMYVFDVGRDGIGKRQQKKKMGYESEADAKKALRIALRNADMNIKPTKEIRLKSVIEEVLNDYEEKVKNGTRKKNTFRKMEQLFRNYLIPNFGDLKLSKMTDKDLNERLKITFEQKTIDGRNANLSDEYKKMIFSALDKVLYHAIRKEYIYNNPLRKLDKPTINKRGRELNFWSENEVKIFLQSAKNSKYYPLFLTLFMTGMRISEVLGLRWQDIEVINVDGQEKAIFKIEQIVNNFNKNNTNTGMSWEFGTTKTLASRRIFNIPSGLWLELKKLKQQQIEAKIENKHDLIFITRNQTPFTRRNVGLYFLKEINKAGLNIITMHQIRHTFATMAYEQGLLTSDELRRRIGHKNFEEITKKKYIHRLPNSKRELAFADALDRLIDSHEVT